MAEQTTFLAGAGDATAAQSTGPEAVAPPPQAATGQTVATPGAQAPAETQPSTSGGADAQSTAPVEVKVPEGVEWSKDFLEAYRTGDEKRIAESGAALQKSLEAAYEKKSADEWEAQGAKWKQELDADKDLGGANAEQTRMLVSRGMNYMPKELAKTLDEFGLGNYPPLIRFLRDLGKRAAEDTVAGTTSPTNGGSAGQYDYRQDYPNSAMNP